jgi:hypothetical protein
MWYPLVVKPIDAFPGIMPLGKIDAIAAYFKTRSLSDLETSATIAVGPEAANFVVGRALEEMLPDTTHQSGIIAILEASGEAVVGQLDGLPRSNFTDYLADHAGISQRKMARAIGRAGLSIVTHFTGHFDRDAISMTYVNPGRRQNNGRLAVVTLHPDHDFVNVHGYHPVTGQGDVANMPDAIEALLEDAQLAANAMAAAVISRSAQ